MMQDTPGGHSVLEAGDAVTIIERDRETDTVRERPARVKYRDGDGGHRAELVVCPDAPEAVDPQVEVARLTGRLKFEIEQTQVNHRAHRYLADKVIEWFNPPDGDESEEWICGQAVMAAGKYIEAQPCICEEGAGYPDYLVDPCARCQVLGRAADKELQR